MSDVLAPPRSSRPAVRAATRASLGFGPALVTAVAYVDPGNVAINFSAGSGYGYTLLWVVIAAGASAGVIQYLSAKLGACTGRSLTQSVGEALGRPGRLAYWAQAELVAAATDVAEVVGGALALHLLFDLPLWMGAVATAVASSFLLRLRTARGGNAFAVAVTAALALIAVGFVGCMIAAGPSVSGMASGLRPLLPDGQALLLASGVFGATVMPHAVYVHSALSRDSARALGGSPVDLDGTAGRVRETLSATRSGVVVAMLVAGTVNASLLIMAAALPRGGSQELEEIHGTVGALLGAVPALALAMALLVSGLASTAVGTHAGDIAMSDLLHRRVPAWVRRLVALAPAVLLLAVGVNTTRLLVLSQVGLSVGIPFALVPLIVFTSRRSLMGSAVNHRATTVAAAAVAAAAIAINGVLLAQLVG
ncbi:Nramp family divalent metal transporter [Streptomyces sp. NPDC048751]|uniref:Nramp family divalent metal transporter n=1 Tax=Streptomyces sp. NPDC048751 TaxID=3365591 RepID=UPI0037185AB9